MRHQHKAAVGYREPGRKRKVAIAFDDDVFEAIRAEAVRRGTSFSRIAHALLRRALKTPIGQEG